jgi:CubicO group peptidase (beta-lactamase class C family)
VVDPDTVRALAVIDQWDAGAVAAALVRPGQEPVLHGAADRPFALASITKILVTLAVLIATEEGSLSLDAAAGPPGSTIRHLLAHASGLAPDGDQVLAEPAARRIYSNRGFEIIGEELSRAAGISTATYVHEALVAPLGLRGTRLDGSPASGAWSTAADLGIVVQNLLAPTLVDATTLATATAVAFPGLAGVLPGFGRQEPNDWGLGFELRDHKRPHWTGTANSAATFGHFGQSGTMLWVDPVARAGLVCLTERPFGPWAATAWPRLSDAVLAEVVA